MSEGGEKRDGGTAAGDVLLLAAGAADLALDTAATALERLRGLLRRPDLPDLAAEGERELAARGRLVRDRLSAAAPPAHLEVLARHAAARHAAARPAGDDG